MKKLHVMIIWGILALTQISIVLGLKKKILLFKDVFNKEQTSQELTTKDAENLQELDDFKFKFGVNYHLRNPGLKVLLKSLKTDPGQRKAMEDELHIVLETSEPYLCKPGSNIKESGYDIDRLYELAQVLAKKGSHILIHYSGILLGLFDFDGVSDWGLSGYEYYALLRFRVSNLAQFIKSKDERLKFSITDMFKYLVSVEKKIQAETKARTSVEKTEEEREAKEKESSKGGGKEEGYEGDIDIGEEDCYTEEEEEEGYDMSLSERLDDFWFFGNLFSSRFL